MRRSHLAETPPAVWVADVRSDAVAVTVAGKTLGEAVVSRGAAVAPTPADSRLAAAQEPDNNSEPEDGLHTQSRFHALALSREAVAVGPRDVFDSGLRAFAAVAAQQGVVAESLGLARVAGRLHRLGGADAFPRHFVAQAAAALARCRRERGRIWGDVHDKTAGGGTLEEPGSRLQ